jgi:hypothetical protein
VVIRQLPPGGFHYPYHPSSTWRQNAAKDHQRMRASQQEARSGSDRNPLVELLMGGGHLLGAMKLTDAAVASGRQRLGTGGVAEQSSHSSGEVSRVTRPVGQASRLARTAPEQLGKGPGS